MIEKLCSYDYVIERERIERMLRSNYNLIKSSIGWSWEGESKGCTIGFSKTYDFLVKRKVLIPKFSKQEEKVQRALGLIGEGTPYILSKEYSTK